MTTRWSRDGLLCHSEALSLTAEVEMVCTIVAKHKALQHLWRWSQCAHGPGVLCVRYPRYWYQICSKTQQKLYTVMTTSLSRDGLQSYSIALPLAAEVEMVSLYSWIW